MNRLILFIILFSIGFFEVNAQLNRFVLLQTADASPFYIKLNKKIFSSTSSGYLIIPKCTGLLQFSLGFPNDAKETVFEIDAKEKDKGYLVKKMQDDNLALFDWQSTDIVYAYTPKTALVINTVHTDTSKSTVDTSLEKMLQTTTGDNSIQTAKQVEDNIKEKVIDTTIAKPILDKHIETPKNVNAPKEEKIVAITDYVAEQNIKKIMQVDNGNGLYTNYQIINADGTIDTLITEISKKEIVLITPNVNDSLYMASSNIPKDTIAATIAENKPVMQETPLTVTKDSVVSSTSVIVDAKPVTVKPMPTMINSNCISNASDDNLMNLFALMAKEKDDDEKITIAKKDFKKRCYSTEQVGKLLGAMFSDKLKYDLLYAAYPYINNTDQYYTLAKKIEDSYYINLFNNMLRK